MQNWAVDKNSHLIGAEVEKDLKAVDCTGSTLSG